VALDKIGERFRLSNAMTQSLRQVFLNYDQITPDLNNAGQKKLLRRIGREAFVHAILTQWARGNDSVTTTHPYMAMIAFASTWQPPKFPLSGDDLIALGIKPGKEMGELLRTLEDAWEAGDYKPTKEELLKKAKR
jgi:poly(A) polymerase